MADSPSHGDTGEDIGEEPGRGSTTGTPRWVKVFGAIALVVVLLLLVMIVTGRGGHGPGRHTGGGGGHTPPSGDAQQL